MNFARAYRGAFWVRGLVGHTHVCIFCDSVLRCVRTIVPEDEDIIYQVISKRQQEQFPVALRLKSTTPEY